MGARGRVGMVAVLAATFVVLALMSLSRASHNHVRASRGMIICTNIYSLYEWASTVGGPDASVFMLEGGGTDPHHFTPSQRDMVLMSRSKAVLVMGMGMDPWTRRVDVPCVWKAGTWITLVNGRMGEPDPHAWLDPGIGAVIVRHLGNVMASINPEKAGGYRSRANALAAELMDLRKNLVRQGAGLSDKCVVTYHDAYGYLLRMLGMRLVGVIRPHMGVDPSMRDVVEATRVMRSIGQRVVLVEPGHEDAVTALAQAVGGSVELLDPITRKNSPCGSTYAERLCHDVGVLMGLSTRGLHSTTPPDGG